MRSFGDDPRRVGQLGAMAAKGLAEAGVLAVGKHFPGHGNAGEDSHAVLPVVSRTAEVLEQVELAPFRTAIKEGIGALMTAHVLYPALDAARPATLSGAIINDLLRHRLGFRGLLFTDCMEMSAIAKGVGTVEGAVQALKAGADMVLVSHSEGVQVATYKAILNAAQSGELPISRLDEAVTRIAMVKAELATQNIQPLTPPEREAIHRLRNATYEASVTVVGDTRSILPLAPGVCVHLVAAREDNTQLTARASLGSNLANHAGLEVREVAQREIWGDTHSLGCQNSLAMVLVRGLPSDDEQMHVLRRITELYPRWIVVSLSSPYDLAALLDSDLSVCLYGADPQALGALAKILSGERPAIGRLPVT
ncbi:MAG: Beta-hexosaminidase [Firmicutes bacterium]|nr:Beta-hexosaminidase [candidate division NPL-UPA2 bacterium]